MRGCGVGLRNLRIILQLDRRGSALVPVMMGFGVLAITITTIMSMTQQTKRAAANASAHAEFNHLIAQVKSILEQEQSCRIALGGPLDIIEEPGTGYNPHTGTGGTETGLEQTFPANHNVLGDIVLYANRAGAKFLEPTAGSTNCGSATEIATKCFGHLQVTRLALTRGAPQTTDGDTYRAYLLIEAEKKKWLTNAGEVLDNWARDPAGAILLDTNGTLMTTIPMLVRVGHVHGPRKILTCNALSFDAYPLTPCKSDEVLSFDGTCAKVACHPTTAQSRVYPFHSDGSMQCVWTGD